MAAKATLWNSYPGGEVKDPCKMTWRRGGEQRYSSLYGARWGLVVNATAPRLYPGKGDAAREGCGEEKTLGQHGGSNLNRPTRSESLYRLRSPSPQTVGWIYEIRFRICIEQMALIFICGPCTYFIVIQNNTHGKFFLTMFYFSPNLVQRGSTTAAIFVIHKIITTTFLVSSNKYLWILLEITRFIIVV